MKDRIEIVASGFGGQGVVRLGQILGEAAVMAGLRVTMLKSHGTEMRGGYVRSQVVLSGRAIDSPICETPDFFIALSLAAYVRFKNLVPPYGLILYDPAFVERTDDSLPCPQRALLAKQLALDHLGKTIFSNTIVVGAMANLLSERLKKETVLESLLAIIPKFQNENRIAFEVGYNAMCKAAGA